MEEEQINQEQNLEATNIDVDEVIENFYASNPNTQETTPAETYQHTTPIDTSAATSDTTSDIEQAVNSNDSISDSDTDTDISDTDTNNTNNMESNLDFLQNNAIKSDIFDVFSDVSMRYSGAAWKSMMANSDIDIVGVGGIGSHLAFMVSRLAPNSIYLYDPDEVELLNLGGQLYGVEDVGQPKVISLLNFIMSNSMYYNTNALKEKVNKYSKLHNITMCGLDSMEARKSVFNTWLEQYRGDPNAILIDGRLAAEEFQIFSIKGNDEQSIMLYMAKYLFNDSEAEQETCSYKQTTFCASMIASYMTAILVNFTYNRLYPAVEREVPFYISCNVPYMLLKVEE